MPTVTISNTALLAIRALATKPLTDPMTRIGPDEWRVVLHETTLQKIQEAAFEEESISDTLLRICSARQ